jgi:hypothetical protein
MLTTVVEGQYQATLLWHCLALIAVDSSGEPNYSAAIGLSLAGLLSGLASRQALPARKVQLSSMNTVRSLAPVKRVYFIIARWTQQPTATCMRTHDQPLLHHPVDNV